MCFFFLLTWSLKTEHKCHVKYQLDVNKLFLSSNFLLFLTACVAITMKLVTVSISVAIDKSSDRKLISNYFDNCVE